MKKTTTMAKHLQKYCKKLNVRLKLVVKSTYFKYFLILIAIYLMALFPLLRANFNYIDDMGRAASGYSNFGFSRYTSDLLSFIVHANIGLTDISPFPQLLSIIIISIASTIVIKLISHDNDKFNGWLVITVLPLGLSPYMLENFSYKFDAPYMALSILVSVFPFLLYGKTKNRTFILASIICTIIMCTTYQASSGIFLQAAIILALIMANQKEEWKAIAKFLTLSIASFIVGILIFKIILMRPATGYVDNSLWSIKDFIPGSIGNFAKFFSLTLEDFNPCWLIAISILIVAFITINLIHSKQRKVISLALSIAAALLLIICSFGLYPFIELPLFAPRSMYGIGTSIALLGLFCVSYKQTYAARATALYLSYAFFIVALTYGNALAYQKNYADFRIGLVINDLNTIVPKDENPLLIDIDGSIGYVKPVTNAINRYKVIGKLVPIIFSDDQQLFGSLYFYEYFNLPSMIKADAEFNKDEMKLIKETQYHNIYQKDNQILVDLK